MGDNVMDPIDFETLLDNISSEDFDIFSYDFPVLTNSSFIIEEKEVEQKEEEEDQLIPPPPPPIQEETLNNYPNSDSSWIQEIEQILMKDDHDKQQFELQKNEEDKDLDLRENFFSQLITHVAVDGDQSVQVRVSSDEDCSNPESNLSDDSREKESDRLETKKDEEEHDNDDQISKKRKRQLRNKDAALRSRERKKLYVRDLELKSRYLETECRRLQQLLHCCYTENQNLHLQLGASMAKQESAVLLLESLLLGSLLWFLGIVCFLMFPLQGLAVVHPNCRPPASVLVAVNVSASPVDLIRAGNKRIGIGTLRLFFKRKRCNATRSKMKKRTNQCLISSSAAAAGAVPHASALLV